MEKEEEKYIKLFTPLQREQEDMVYNIWKENIFEDIYHREIAIEKYCKEVNCDFLMALYSIIKIIENRYLMSLSNGEIAYPSKSLVEKLILENEVYKREEYGHLEIIDQKMCELNEKGYLDYPYIHIKLTQKDVNDLKNACEALIKERLKNIQPYIDNSLNAPCIIENYDILPQIERQFYYQIEKIKQDETTDKFDNKKEIVYDKQEKNIDEKEEEIKEEDENKEYYVSISKRLNQFIKRGTPENYSHIVNEKSFSNKRKYLIINRPLKKDCVLFAKVFNLTKDSLVAILKQKDGKNCKEIELTNQYFNRIEINLANPTEYEKALIKVRNECLNKINPSDFPILERNIKKSCK